MYMSTLVAYINELRNYDTDSRIVKTKIMKKIIGAIFLLIFINNQVLSQETKLSISELVINSTIRIECSGDTIVNGKKARFTSIGTGFYFQFKIDSLYLPVIVTNYHVIKKTDKCKLNFTESILNKPNYGSIITETINYSENPWIRHPKVDLAILPINPIIQNIIKTENKIPYVIYYTEDLLPTKKLLDSLSAIEEVFMIGYPKGLWDKTNNLPIVRKGITATPVYLDYEGNNQFLLDIPIYSGSSGSPVVLLNQGSFPSRTGALAIGNRLALLGINVQSKEYDAEGELILPSINAKIETKTKLPINIAIVIKSEELLEFKPILKNLLGTNNK